MTVLWHPSESDLALIRSGDLSGWKQSLVGRHIARCVPCARRAAAYEEIAGELRALAEPVAEPAWLPARISAAASSIEGPVTSRVPSGLAPAGAMLLIVVLALMLLAQRPALPQRLDYQAFATKEAVGGEVVGPQGRQRVVIYTGFRGGVVEVSTGDGAVGVSRADPATGAITITRVSIGE